MSGAQIGGVVGGIIGAVWGGGNWQLGYAIGSAIGGAVDPTKVYGPRLTDASAQTSKDGVICPWGYGTFPCMGNVIWQGPLTERKHKDDGKGSGTEQVTYTYHRSYAIRICEGPITGILQIKRNGKIVYDARTDAALQAEYEAATGGPLVDFDGFKRRLAATHAYNSRFLNNATIYLGDETQLPDPIIESHEGVGNVSPFRGRAYIVVEDDDLTDSRGAIAQYEFVVSVNGTSGEECQENQLRAKAVMWLELGDGGVGGFPDKASPSEPGYLFGGGGGSSISAMPSLFANGSGSMEFLDLPGFTISSCRTSNAAMSASMAGNGFGYSTWFRIREGSLRSRHGLIRRAVDTSASHFTATVDNATGAIDFEINFSAGGALLKIFRSVRSGLCDDTPHHLFVYFDNSAGTYNVVIDGVLDSTVSHPYPVFGSTYETQIGAVQGDEMLDGQIAQTAWFVGDLSISDAKAIYNNGAGVSYSSFIPDSAVAIPDSPGMYVAEDGSIYMESCSGVIDTGSVVLGTIVADLCQRAGLVADEYDVSQLTDLVPGFRVASESGADGMIAPLMQAYYFDAGEWDGKLRFVKRGGTPVMSLTMDDLVERDGDPIEKTRVQEAELLRRVTVGYLDPDAGYTSTTQKWERRTSTVQAKGEQGVEVPVVMDADTAAGVAKKKGLIGWAETERFKQSLPYRLSALTPTDVILQTDEDGTEYPIRIIQSDEDSGVLLLEGDLDGRTIYSATAIGVRPKPRTITEPSIIGPTTLHVMDLPVWDKDVNDELGVYVAARGILGGWNGAAVQFSTDTGATWTTAATVTVPSNIGFTASALPAWDSAEYPSVQSVQVYLPEAPASVTREALLSNRNRAALKNDSGAWEIFQYETVVDDGDGYYTLSGLVRGRYATTPGLASSGAAFVLLDETVQFVRAERAYLGEAITVRGVSLGTVPENNASSTLTITGASQTEWAPHMVTAGRDGSDNVTVAWVERRRLGTEIAPYNGKYHSGFRVTYSDGQTFDVVAGSFTHTRSAAPSSQTITVSALNTITGAGPASEAVTA